MNPGGQLSIGSDCLVNYGIAILTSRRVELGSHCLIGSRTLILDSYQGRTDPVVIEDDVWLAHGVTVMPGVKIGKGSIISAGTVVD